MLWGGGEGAVVTVSAETSDGVLQVPDATDLLPGQSVTLTGVSISAIRCTRLPERRLRAPGLRYGTGSKSCSRSALPGDKCAAERANRRGESSAEEALKALIK